MNLRGRERSAAAVFTAVIVLLRLWFARHVSFCGTPDSCYTLGVAQSVAKFHAFHVPFLFDLLLPSLHVPNTGIEYWRPGAALVLLLFRPFGSLSLHGSLVVATLAGVVWALAAWHIAVRTTGNRRIALASYSLCLVFSAGWGGSLAPDPTLFYAAAIAWFLALFTVERQGLLQDVLALVCVGAAYLIRNDAILLLAPLAVVLYLRWRRARQAPAAASGSSALYAVAMLAGFVLALVPMHLLYRHVLGTAFPSGASQALYLNDLSDFSTYGLPVNRHTLLAHGIKHLLLMRVSAASFIVYRVLALVLGYAALIFLPSLAVSRERRNPTGPSLPEGAGAVTFGIVVFSVYSLVLPAVGVFSALRSSTALLPVVSVVVIVAIARVSITRRVAVVLTAAVIAVYTVSGIMDDRRDTEAMNQVGATDRAEASGLAAMGADPGQAIVMTPDPVQFSVTTGYQAIPLPSNGLGAITKEALDLHATHAILDGEHLPGTPDAIAQQLHPSRMETLPAQHAVLLELSPER